MARSRSDARKSPAALRQRALVLAVLAMLLPLTSCATMFNGTTQRVPVTSGSERAEVFVDGVSMGFTPVELRLPRKVDVTVDVRLGHQVRSFVLQSETQGALVALDLVPMAVTGGLVIFAGALGASIEGGRVETGGYVAGIALLGASLAPVVVDYGTGAIFRLSPGEIVAVFD